MLTHDAPLWTNPSDPAMRWARGGVGAYGENAGGSCPWCGTRQYPAGHARDIIDCEFCGEPMALPLGYDA